MIAAFSTELFKKSCKWEEKERSKDAYPGRGGGIMPRYASHALQTCKTLTYAVTLWSN